jgi:hypothetical protein
MLSIISVPFFGYLAVSPLMFLSFFLFLFFFLEFLSLFLSLTCDRPAYYCWIPDTGVYRSFGSINVIKYHSN